MSPGLGLLIGESQTLRYGTGATEIVVALSSYNFKPGQGQGYQPLIGYDRVLDSEYRRSITRSTTGTPYWRGPSFAAPHKFVWSLQLLTHAQLRDIQAICLRQQRDRLPARLIDQRLALSEASPRTRAKIGPLILGASPGTIAYWAQFEVELEHDPPVFFADGLWELSLRGKEMGLVNLSEDL